MSYNTFLHSLEVISRSSSTSWKVSLHVEYNASKPLLSTILIATSSKECLCTANITLPKLPSPSYSTILYSERTSVKRWHSRIFRLQVNRASGRSKKTLSWPLSLCARTRALLGFSLLLSSDAEPFIGTFLMRHWNESSARTIMGFFLLFSRVSKRFSPCCYRS